MSGVQVGDEVVAAAARPDPHGEIVAAILVSHDGARWLPAVIEGLQTQTRPLDQVVVVDTTSRDESPALLEAAFGPVRTAPGSTGYPVAVRLGLEQVDPRASWIWLLHDDANPDPGALEALLAAAADHPEASILGPKLREWPSLRRLLELGVTISGTGRRETGLERGEYDQGQHDDVRRVLAVNTAGMLVRRDVLEQLGGFDEQLPVFGNDLDFGWRAAAAGHQTLIVPQAVVFHAEAAHRGVRTTPLTGRHTHYQERRAALYTLVVNGRARALPLQIVRLTLGTLLRVLGFLLVRSVGEALDELAALVSLMSSPRQVLAARRERQGRVTASPQQVRRLLAPAWLPYRHGLDALSDLAAAATNQAADVAERRRAVAAELDPASFAARRPVVTDDDEMPEADSGLVARFLTNPVAVLMALLVVVAVVAARPAFGPVSGGGLSPAPDSVWSWWRLHLESWHPLGAGTDVPAPAYLLPLTLLATLLGASPTAAVSAVLVAAVPVGLWGAWRFLRVAGRLVSPRGTPRWMLLAGSATYALVPAGSGAWGDGRLGTVASAALLPWLAHAALGFADPDGDRRRRAAWRAGLLLTVVTAATPVAWLFALVLGAVVTAAGLAIVPGAVRTRSTWSPPATALLVPVVLLLPWWLPAVLRDSAESLLLDTGRLPAPTVDGLDLLAGRLGDLGAPVWIGVAPLLLALVALVPRATRIPVLVCWIAATVAAVLALALSATTLDLAAISVAPGVSFLVVALQGALVAAAVLGGMGVAAARSSVHRRSRQPVLVAAVVLAAIGALAPLLTLGWWAVGSDDDLAGSEDSGIPAYMVQRSELGPAHGILVVRGDVETGLTYVVRRGDGITLGEDEILDTVTEDRDFTAQVRALASRPTPSVVDTLADAGIEYVVLPAPADGDVAASLDATGGLVQASAEDRATRAWQINRELADDVADGPRSWLRLVLLLVQGLGIVVVVVLCAPTADRSRSR
ncbi:unannotated protein [freshwater metagenome]|uniref:Unannotated protein n=1 Tax=freshwater metagenome TaxID=449393 RepID=A0A6J6P7H4_9ZZZZ